MTATAEKDKRAEARRATHRKTRDELIKAGVKREAAIAKANEQIEKAHEDYAHAIADARAAGLNSTEIQEVTGLGRQRQYELRAVYVDKNEKMMRKKGKL